MFVVLSYGLAWLVASPLWSGPGLTDSRLPVLAVLMMATPAVVSVLGWRPPHAAQLLGLVPLRPRRRTLGYVLVGLLGAPTLGLLALLLGAALNVATLTTSPGTAAALAGIPLYTALILVPAFGEELGWRGFLLPALCPLGTWPALLLSGAVWGVWHSPLILLGYNYGLTNGVGVLLMTVSTTLIGVLFGWLRMRSASVWPSTFAHASFNASSGLLLAALLPPGQPDVTPSLLGWVGWIVIAVVVVLLAALRTFRWAGPGTTSARSATDVGGKG